MKLSDQQKKILLVLELIECENKKSDHNYYFNKNTIHSLIEIIEPTKIRTHGFTKNKNKYIDKTRYASYHRSLNNLIKKKLMNNIFKTGVEEKKGWSLYGLTETGKQTVEKIVKEISTKYSHLRGFMDIINLVPGDHFNINFNKIYVLYRKEEYNIHNSSYETEQVIGIYHYLRDAFHKIMDMENDFENYSCDCHNEEYKKEEIQNYECSSCKQEIHFNIVGFSIEQRIFNKEKHEFIYDSKYDYEKNLSMEGFADWNNFDPQNRKLREQIDWKEKIPEEFI